MALREHVHDLDAMAERITGKTRLVFVCNPNNPTGTAVERDALVRFLRAGAARTSSSRSTRPTASSSPTPHVPDGLTLLDELPNLVVLRTFSKAYGLAGLRIGYAVAADPALITALRQTQVPFAVSSLAQAAALASLEPPAEAQMRDRVPRSQPSGCRVRDALLSSGYDVPPTQANFVWLGLGRGHPGLRGRLRAGRGGDPAVRRGGRTDLDQ